MITLASHVFEYFLRFLLQACVFCTFWLRWGSHGVTPPPFLPTLTFSSRAVPLLGFLGFFGVRQSYSCVGVDRHDDYSADSSASLRRSWSDRILSIPPFIRRVRDERWPRRRIQGAAGGLGGERNSSIPLRGFTIPVSVGFAMNRTDRIRISR